MKSILFWLIGAVIIVSCSTQKGIVEIKDNQEKVAQEDSVEYELEVFDPKFESWYQLHDNPSQYRSEQYYENWNRQYVSAWNEKAYEPGKNSFFEPIVGWDPTVDYGFELNHKLFYYFQYVENVLHIQIMPGGPKSIPL